MTTKNKFSASMFDKIKDALKKTDGSGGNSSYSNIMKFPAGHTYTIRLIPNIESIDDTFFHHFIHQWTSKNTGQFTSVLSLQTFNERDPIAEARWKLYSSGKAGNDQDLELAKDIQRKENWYVNVYVVEDPSNPENNGTVKVLKMGPQLKDIVDEAMNGDRADEFGAAIFDLSSDGVDFKIKAEKQGEYTTFIKSFFSAKSKLDLDDSQIEEVYTKVHDLKQIHPVKTYEELKTLLDEHFFCNVSDSSETKEERKPLAIKKTESIPTPVKKTAKVEEEEDEIPMSYADDELDEIDELLAGLDA